MVARNIHWGNTLGLILLHVGAFAAMWFVTWQGIALLFVLHWLTGGIGICLGFHRLFTHRSFQTYRLVRWGIALLGGLAGEGSVGDWVANHRKHHAHSDREGDPHSPQDGIWWSHVLWISYANSRQDQRAHRQRWAPDVSEDHVVDWMSRLVLPIQILLGALLFVVGYGLGGAALGCSLLLWGLFVRLVFVMHSTWFVNSVSHRWGYRSYETSDDSRNSWWVALLTYGEGWHNNHHAYPRMANHGHRWWEYDVTYATIRLMRLVGLAWDVVDYRDRHERTGRQAGHPVG